MPLNHPKSESSPLKVNEPIKKNKAKVMWVIYYYCLFFLLFPAFCPVSLPFKFIWVRHSLLCSFFHSFIHSFIHSFMRSFLSFNHSCVHLFIHSFIHLYLHSFFRPFIHSFIYLFIYSFIYSFIQPPTHPSIHSFIHSFACSIVLMLFLIVYLDKSDSPVKTKSGSKLATGEKPERAKSGNLSTPKSGRRMSRMEKPGDIKCKKLINALFPLQGRGGDGCF